MKTTLAILLLLVLYTAASTSVAKLSLASALQKNQSAVRSVTDIQQCSCLNCNCNGEGQTCPVTINIGAHHQHRFTCANNDYVSMNNMKIETLRIGEQFFPSSVKYFTMTATNYDAFVNGQEADYFIQKSNEMGASCVNNILPGVRVASDTYVMIVCPEQSGFDLTQCQFKYNFETTCVVPPAKKIQLNAPTRVYSNQVFTVEYSLQTIDNRVDTYAIGHVSTKIKTGEPGAVLAGHVTAPVINGETDALLNINLKGNSYVLSAEFVHPETAETLTAESQPIKVVDQASSIKLVLSKSKMTVGEKFKVTGTVMDSDGEVSTHFNNNAAFTLQRKSDDKFMEEELVGENPVVVSAGVFTTELSVKSAADYKLLIQVGTRVTETDIVVTPKSSFNFWLVVVLVIAVVIVIVCAVVAGVIVFRKKKAPQTYQQNQRNRVEDEEPVDQYDD